MKTRLNLLMLSAVGAFAILLAVITGCQDTTTNTNPTYVDNPNVRTFDSIGVVEDSAAFKSYTGINLLDGVTTIDSAKLRDCSLQDLDNLGVDFYLQNGMLLNNIQSAGYEIRFFRVDPDMSVAAFDSLAKITTTGHDTLRAVDFTEDNTAAGGAWGYFNANTPLNYTPVYCFWLKGKKDFGITSKNVYGIIQPREATDREPHAVYGYRMSFRVRININGDNDFRKKILQ
jgi:hypothetical protein